MEDGLNISLDSLEENEDNPVNNDPSFSNQKMIMVSTFPKMNIMSSRSLPSYYSSKDFNLCAPNRSGKSKIQAEKVNLTKKLTYLEIFRKRMSFGDDLLPRKKNSESVQVLRGCSCIKGNSVAHHSNQVDDSSSGEESEDHCSLNTSGSSLLSVGMGEAFNTLNIISHEDTIGEKSIASQSSAVVQKGHKKIVDKGSIKMDECHTHLLKSNQLLPLGVSKSKSFSAREGYSDVRNKDLTQMEQKTAVSFSEKEHHFTMQNKLSKFLMRTAYGNSVSDFNCKIKAGPRKLKTPKNIVSPAVSEEPEAIGQVNKEKKVTEQDWKLLKFKSMKAKLVTEKKKEKPSSEKNATRGAHSKLEIKNVSKSSAVAKRNANKRDDSNAIFNLEFLMERHHKESQLLKKISEDVFRNTVK